MSKLYTEEEVRELADMIQGHKTDELMSSLTPIELPSDEEISTYVVSTGYYGHCTQEYHEGIEDGAKWYRDKIKGGNK